MTAYTLVQHSAWLVGQDSSFYRAVETQHLDARQIPKVEKAGGLVFPTYDAASDAELAVNYPPGVQGLIPHCRGTFGATIVDGLPLYLPTDEDRQAVGSLL